MDLSSAAPALRDDYDEGEMRGKWEKETVGNIVLNGHRCERRPLVYFNSSHSQRRPLKIFKIQ